MVPPIPFVLATHCSTKCRFVASWPARLRWAPRPRVASPRRRSRTLACAVPSKHTSASLPSTVLLACEGLRWGRRWRGSVRKACGGGRRGRPRLHAAGLMALAVKSSEN